MRGAGALRAFTGLNALGKLLVGLGALIFVGSGWAAGAERRCSGGAGRKWSA